jgi:hypothetical protein
LEEKVKAAFFSLATCKNPFPLKKKTRGQFGHKSTNKSFVLKHEAKVLKGQERVS